MGPAGMQGPAGPTGPTGVVTTVSVASALPSIISVGPDWTFQGNTATVTLADNQRLTGAGAAALGANPAVTGVGIALCYQREGGTIVDFGENAWTDTSIPTSTTALPVAGSAPRTMGGTALTAGTYKVGFCVRNMNASVSINNNDWVTFWVQVTN